MEGVTKDCLRWRLGLVSKVAPEQGRILEKKQVWGRWIPLWVLWALLQGRPVTSKESLAADVHAGRSQLKAEAQLSWTQPWVVARSPCVHCPEVGGGGWGAGQ